MPLPLEYSDRPHFALVWMATGEYDDYGQPTVADVPDEIRVRWIERLVETVGEAGTMRSRVATVNVPRDIPTGSKMWRGKLVDWYGTGSGDESSRESELMEVTSYNEYTDLKGRSIKRTVNLEAGRRQ